jgi:hypothetical protein
MNILRRRIRQIALLLMMLLASVLPVPITYYRKDNLPKYVIEEVDTKEGEAEEDNIKELF